MRAAATKTSQNKMVLLLRYIYQCISCRLVQNSNVNSGCCEPIDGVPVEFMIRLAPSRSFQVKFMTSISVVSK